ncbi:MAG: hypothetical protein LUE17_16460 [Planctomycetaceae bacterium]|nr:hypothetical protein [Planctomycetaceae bacterium]
MALNRPLARFCLPVVAVLLLQLPVRPAHAAFAPDKSYLDDQAVLDRLQRDAFRFFWEYGDPHSGMAYEANYDWAENAVAVGGTGFAIAATIAAVDREWVTRDDALSRLMKIVTFLRDKTPRQRLHGAFPHWLDGKTGKALPFGDRDEGADLVETSFLMQGLLIARAYFNGPGVEEKLRAAITGLWEDVDWNWFTNGEDDGLYWHWDPKGGFHNGLKILGYNECLITYVLAIASPTHPISRKAYDYWTSGAAYLPRSIGGYEVEATSLSGGPLFLSHYSFIGLNPHLLADAFVKNGYFVRGVKHTLANRGYCLYEAPPQNKYSETFWGLSACQTKNGYFANDPINDNGTVAPTAALSSMPYTPHYSMQVLHTLANGMKRRAWGEYGPYDAVSLRDDWVSNYLAIDQMPMVCMVENYRSGLLWNQLMGDKDIRQGLLAAGFHPPRHAEGFPEAVVALRRDGDEVVPDAYAMRRHPDTGLYGLPFFLEQAREVKFRIMDADGETVFETTLEAAEGANTLTFAQFMPPEDEVLTVFMDTGGTVHTLPIRLY